MKSTLIFPLAVPVIFLTGCEKSTTEKSGSAVVEAADGRCPHDIKPDKCPFCTPTLVESQGFCGEHGVPEALCYLCRPFLKTAFRAKGDWCKAHEAPDSQCALCHPELRERARPGSGHGQPLPAGAGLSLAGVCLHEIDPAKCPFCKPELVESEGYCQEHDIAEALCVKCRPYLEKAFKAKHDWCTEHATPESQCVVCNPSIKNKKEP